MGPVDVGVSIAVYTDGSYERSTGRCGGGAILCDKASLLPGFVPGRHNTVHLTVPAPAASASWSGELASVVASMLATPVNVELWFAVDALSEIPVLTRECPESFGRRLRMGDHALVVTGRNLIRLRSGFGAPTHFRWIPAHTGGTDLDSVMNSEADRLAGLGARRGPSPPFLANEEDVVFWSLAPGALESPDPLEDVASHISGNFSARLRRGLLDRAMGSLQRLSAHGC